MSKKKFASNWTMQLITNVLRAQVSFIVFLKYLDNGIYGLVTLFIILNFSLFFVMLKTNELYCHLQCTNVFAIVTILKNMDCNVTTVSSLFHMWNFRFITLKNPRSFYNGHLYNKVLRFETVLKKIETCSENLSWESTPSQRTM